MPPSGFSQKAINGLLVFVRDGYEQTLKQYDNSNKEVSEKEFLNETVRVLQNTVKKMVDSSPLPVSKNAIEGITVFMTTCYEDLVKEIVAGQDKYYRDVVDGKAMQKEIDQINDYLLKFKL